MESFATESLSPRIGLNGHGHAANRVLRSLGSLGNNGLLVLMIVFHALPTFI